MRYFFGLAALAGSAVALPQGGLNGNNGQPRPTTTPAIGASGFHPHNPHHTRTAEQPQWPTGDAIPSQSWGFPGGAPVVSQTPAAVPSNPAGSGQGAGQGNQEAVEQAQSKLYQDSKAHPTDLNLLVSDLAKVAEAAQHGSVHYIVPSQGAPAPTGAPGGSPGAAPSGVPAGIPSGVPAGVPSGISSGVPTPSFRGGARPTPSSGAKPDEDDEDDEDSDDEDEAPTATSSGHGFPTPSPKALKH